MSLIPTIYSSTDPGAPALTGQAGSLTNLLDAILVDGYGSGEAAKAPLGWTREFTDTNKRIYRNDPTLGTGTYLRVDDSAASGTARFAWVRAFSSVTDVDNGTDPVPSPAQMASGSLVPKSLTLDSTGRPWVAIGNSTGFYFFVAATSTNVSASSPFFFGDIDSRVPGDGGRFMVSCSNLNDWTNSGNQSSYLFSGSTYLESTFSDTGPDRNGYLCLSYTGGIISAPVGGVTNDNGSSTVTNSAIGGSGGTYPDPIGGALLYKRVTVREGQYLIRGYLPGVLAPQHNKPFADMEIVDDVNVGGICRIFAKTFRTRYLSNSNFEGQVLFVLDREW